MFMLKKNFKAVLCGLLTGAVNGLFGGGGGMVVVPLLKNLLGYDVCAASAVTYIAGGYFSAGVAIPAAVGAVAGGLLGALMLNKLPEFVVNAVFIAVMLAAGIRMLI